MTNHIRPLARGSKLAGDHSLAHRCPEVEPPACQFGLLIGPNGHPDHRKSLTNGRPELIEFWGDFFSALGKDWGTSNFSAVIITGWTCSFLKLPYATYLEIFFSRQLSQLVISISILCISVYRIIRRTSQVQLDLTSVDFSEHSVELLLTSPRSTTTGLDRIPTKAN